MNALTGTTRLIRLALRRDRFLLPIWVLGLTVFLLMTTQMTVTSFPTRADLVRETQFMAANPGMRVMSLSAGANLGAYDMSRSYLTLAILAAVMSVLAVVRHTRQSEERGRDELLRAGVVGPCASLAAAVTVTLAADLALAPLLGMAMIVNGLPVASSFAAGAAIAAVGVAFTGVAALTSQLSSTARGANGLAMGALGVAFALSALGNMLGHVDEAGVVAYSAWPTWLSPLGWGYEMRPFGGDRWWLLALFVVLAAALIAAAVWYAARRDLGRGVFPVQTGAAEASPRLLGPIGLAWRLQRSAFLAWLVGVLGFGLIFGSVMESATNVEGSMRDWYEKLAATGDMVDALVTSFAEFAGMMAAIYAVQVLLRMREEETRGRLEPVLAGAVSRPRWMASYLVTTAFGVLGLLLVFAAGMGITAGLALGDVPGLLREVTGATMAQLPAVLSVAAVVVVLFALVPRHAAVLSWLVLGAAILLSPMWGLSLGLPQWALDFSPFSYQKVPAQAVSTAAIVALLGIAAGLVAAGLTVFRRRDLVA